MSFNPEPKSIPNHVMLDVLRQISEYHEVESHNEYYDDAVSLAFREGYLEDATMKRYNTHAFEKDYKPYAIYLSQEGQRKLAQLEE